MGTIRLFIVEDQPTILKNQVKLLRDFSDIEIVGTALSGEEALGILKELDPKPHVILCDMGLPQMTGAEVTRFVKTHHPAIEVLIFTVFDEEEKVLEAVQAGAAGYMLKGAPVEKVHENILEVAQGGSVIQPTLARNLLKHFLIPIEEELEVLRTYPKQPLDSEDFASAKKQLTLREVECLQIIAKGLSNTEAAQVLGLSKATIRTHLEHIYQKLEVTNRVEAVTEGIRQGLIEI